MIRINLLPVRAVKKQELGKQQLFLFGLVIAATVLGNGYWLIDRQTAASRLDAQVAKTKKEIAEVEKTIGEVKNIANERDRIKQKLSVLDTLRKGRTGPVKMLDALATAIPKNVWITKMGESKGGGAAGGVGISVDGAAISNDDIAEFMKGLTSLVWTPEGMARLVVGGGQPGATMSQVELYPSGQIKELPVDKVKHFFEGVVLKKATLKGTKEQDQKIVDFQLLFTAFYAL